MPRVVRESPISEIFESIGLGRRFETVKDKEREKEWSAPEFGVKPVLWRYTALLPIDEYIVPTLCHPAERCTGN
jgi:hypothetical protein